MKGENLLARRKSDLGFKYIHRKHWLSTHTGYINFFTLTLLDFHLSTNETKTIFAELAA